MQRGEKTEVLLEPRLSSSQTSQVFGVNVAELKKRWPFLESELIFLFFSCRAETDLKSVSVLWLFLVFVFSFFKLSPDCSFMSRPDCCLSSKSLPPLFRLLQTRTLLCSH